MSVPAIRAIKDGRLDAHVTIATPAKIAPLWKLVPEVDAMVPLTSNSVLAAVRSIRARPRFDVAILFPNSLRVALEARLSGIRRRIGYRGHSRSWLLNQIIHAPQLSPPEHQSIRYLRIAQKCGALTKQSLNEKTPSVQLRKDSRAGSTTLDSERFREPAAQLVDANQQSSTCHVEVERRRINYQLVKLALCPGAEYGPAKRWPPERFAEVAVKVAAQAPVQWVLFGTPKDVEIGEQIAAGLGDACLNRIGQTTLDQLILALGECRLLLTNDTGTMHLASLLRIPLVAIFGSTEPGLTGPLGDRHIVLRHHVECSPCFLRRCPIDFRCMQGVAVQEVVDAVLSLL
jgi:lipopolysaccharide heptosyltransferase II